MTPDRRASFEAEVLPLQDELLRAALRYTRDKALAEDLLQDTLVRAYRFWGGFAQGTSLRAWLHTILRNTFITGYHRRSRARAAHDELDRHTEALGPDAALVSQPAPRPDPEQAMATALTRARIDAALDSLPEDYRHAVVLADLEGMSYREIAEIMDTPMGTVMSRIHRGRKQLHKLLFEHAVELGVARSRPATAPATPPAPPLDAGTSDADVEPSPDVIPLHSRRASGGRHPLD
jgi:RNA polymerase sigma-70 factor (ECF subfamily)